MNTLQSEKIRDIHEAIFTCCRELLSFNPPVLHACMRERERERERAYMSCTNSEISITLVGLLILSVEKCCILWSALENTDDSRRLLLGLCWCKNWSFSYLFQNTFFRDTAAPVIQIFILCRSRPDCTTFVIDMCKNGYTDKTVHPCSVVSTLIVSCLERSATLYWSFKWVCTSFMGVCVREEQRSTPVNVPSCIQMYQRRSKLVSAIDIWYVRIEKRQKHCAPR